MSHMLFQGWAWHCGEAVEADRPGLVSDTELCGTLGKSLNFLSVRCSTPQTAWPRQGCED